MTAQDAPPPVPPAAAQPAPERRESTELVAVNDLPLVLVKGPQREQAVVRRALFVTSSVSATLTVDQPPTYAWTHKSFLQRQVCFTSITGLFSCAAPIVEPLPDTETGQAPLSEPDAYPAADAAGKKLSASLKTRSTALFDADRRLNVDPFLRAAGVTVAGPPRAAPPRAGGPGARGAPAAKGGSAGRK